MPIWLLILLTKYTTSSTGLATPLRGSTVVSLMQHCHLVIKYFHYTTSVLDKALQKRKLVKLTTLFTQDWPLLSTQYTRSEIAEKQAASFWKEIFLAYIARIIHSKETVLWQKTRVHTLRSSSHICCIICTSKSHPSSGRNGTGLKQTTITCTSVLGMEKRYLKIQGCG